jgi:pimeloyl-ACP methyl ester carboxylesterase
VRAAVRLVEHVAATAGGPVHLFGNSLGGAVAVRLAATRPDLVRTLTLISPAMPVIRPRRGTDPRLVLLLLPGLSTLLSRASKRQTAQARVLEVVDLVYGERPDIPQVRLDEAVYELERRRGLPWFDTALMASLRGLARSYFMLGERSLWRQAATIQAPTLVLWGRHDRLVSSAIAGRVQETIPHARLLVLERCGHVAMLEEPTRVAREFTAFATL